MICSMRGGQKRRGAAGREGKEISDLRGLLGKWALELNGVHIAYIAGSGYNSTTSGTMTKILVPSSLPPRDRGDMQTPQMMGLSLQNLRLQGSSSE